MPIVWKTNNGWQFQFILPTVPGSPFGTQVVMTGYILVLEALWRNI